MIESVTPVGNWGVWALGKVICGMGIGSVQATLPVVSGPSVCENDN